MTNRSTPSYPQAQHNTWARKALIHQAAAILTFGIGIMAIAARVDLGARRWTLVLGAGGLLTATAFYTEHLIAHARAACNRIGADSEQLVADQLEQLRAEGYTITHGARWPDGGDIDHLVRTPDGLAILIETKTRSYDAQHLDRLRHQADWAADRREHPRGVLPALCVAREHGLQQLVDGVLIISPDQLIDAITAAHTAA